MIETTNCNCPFIYHSKFKMHQDGCAETCSKMVTKDRFYEPKRCSALIKRRGLCGKHVRVKEKVERRKVVLLNARGVTI